MADDNLLILISAYADGELDGASAAALEGELTRNPELARALAACKKLDAAAQNIPVPQIDAKLSARWKAVRETAEPASSAAIRKIEAAAIPVPQVPPARFAAAWKNISERTVAPSASDREGIQQSAQHDGEAGPVALVAGALDAKQWTALDRAAAELRVPEMDPIKTTAVWHAIAAATVSPTPADRAAWAQLDAAAANISVPQVGAKKFAQAWSSVDARTHSDAGVPAVSDDRWNNVWRSIQARTTAKAAPAAAPAAPPNIVRADFKPRRSMWKWVTTAGIAAALIVGALLLPTTRKGDDPAAAMVLEIPEVLDDRYHVQVKYLEGQSQPVVCFFLNEPQEDSELPNWHWLPD